MSTQNKEQYQPQQSPEINKVYTESPEITQAKLNLESQLGKTPAGYQSNYSEGINKLLNGLNNPAKAPVTNIQQYRQEHENNINRAAEDTAENLSKLSGGYGNTYSAAVSDQQKQQAMLEANNINPALMQLAMAASQEERNNKLRLLDAYATQDAIEYGRHRDKVSDNLAEQQYLMNQILTQQQNDRANFESDRSFNQGAFQFTEGQKQAAFEEYENRRLSQEQTDKENSLKAWAQSSDNYYNEQNILNAIAKASEDTSDFTYDPDIVDPVEEAFKDSVISELDFNIGKQGRGGYLGFDTYEDYIDAKLDDFKYKNINGEEVPLSDNQKQRLMVYYNTNFETIMDTTRYQKEHYDNPVIPIKKAILNTFNINRR